METSSEDLFARNSYWGDTSFLIGSQNDIDSLCDQKTEAISCKVKTSPQGVRYAEVAEEVIELGADPVLLRS